MTTAILILALVAIVAATVKAILRDERGHLPSPRSNQVDPAFLPPSAQLTHR